jgi:hypothetical protein
MYDRDGPFRGMSTAGMTAWIAAAIVYFAANRFSDIGGTLPALAASVLVYVVMTRRWDRSAAE